MSLKTSSVSKCLDKKMMILGFEVYDVLAIFMTLSILNFIFGSSSLKILFVWLPSLALAAVLRFGKRGKPDKYLVHLIRFQIKPGILSAFPPPSMNEPCPRFRRALYE